MAKLKQFKVSIGDVITHVELRSTIIEADGLGMAMVLANTQLWNDTERVRSVTQF